MYCKKCGRELPDQDSLYCCYCGTRLPDGVTEPDWEFAARMRELEEEQPSRATPGKHASKYDTGCITPGAPRKKCAVCGRELPSSTAGKLCALCTMRQQQDAERAEDAEQERLLQLRIAQGKADRYDVSDEFDWTAFEQNANAYVHEDASPREEEPRQNPKQPKKTSRQNNNLTIILSLAIFASILVGGPVIFNLIRDAEVGIDSEAVLIPEPVTTAVQDVPAETELSSIEEESSFGTGFPEPEVELDPNMAAILESILYNEIEQTYSDYMEYQSISTDGLTVNSRGVVNTVEGNVDCTAQASGHDEAVIFELPFKAAFVVTETPDGILSGYPLGLIISEEILYDFLDYVDMEGYITEAGAEYFGQPVGTYPYNETPIAFSDY